MARNGYHSYEVGGMPMGHLPHRSPMGMDPNYRGGAYRGERFRESEDGAPYGRYRAEHRRELEDHGGARGRATGAGLLRTPPPSRPSGPFGPPQPRSTENLRGRSGGEPWGSAGRGRYGRRYDRDFGGPAEPRGGRYGGEVGRYGAGSRGDGGRGGSQPRRLPQGGDGREGRFEASRPRRYDGGMDRYGGPRGGGFGRGYRR